MEEGEGKRQEVASAADPLDGRSYLCPSLPGKPEGGRVLPLRCSPNVSVTGTVGEGVLDPDPQVQILVTTPYFPFVFSLWEPF